MSRPVVAAPPTNRQYDGLGRLEKESVPYKVTAAGGTYQAPDWNRPRTGYSYDGDGQRVQATVNGQATAYVGNYLEWSGSTGTIVRYNYAGRQRVAMRKGSALYYVLGDHLGSTAATVDSGGTRVAELRYNTSTSRGVCPSSWVSTS